MLLLFGFHSPSFRLPQSYAQQQYKGKKESTFIKHGFAHDHKEDEAEGEGDATVDGWPGQCWEDVSGEAP